MNGAQSGGPFVVGSSFRSRVDQSSKRLGHWSVLILTIDFKLSIIEIMLMRVSLTEEVKVFLGAMLWTTFSGSGGRGSSGFADAPESAKLLALHKQTELFGGALEFTIYRVL